jgi:hypothetical protein
MPLPSVLTSWRSLTRVVNEIKPDATAVSSLVFPGEGRAFSTPEIRYDVVEGIRETAPFVRRGGEAIRIKGYGHKRNIFETPNIKLKMEIDPEAYAQSAAAGTIQEILAGSNSMEASARAQAARDLTRLKRLITNTKEWMACRVLDGSLSYLGTEGQDAWEIIFADRSSGHDFTFDISNSVTAAGGVVGTETWLKDVFRLAKHRINKQTGMNCQIVVGGETAVSKLMNSKEWKDTYKQALPGRIQANEVNVSLTSDIGANGMVFEGVFGQLPVYTYTYEVTPYGGAAEALIPTDNLYFIATGPAAENEWYYGGIYDMKTMNQSYALREFAKAWEQDDPSLGFTMIQTRPLPVLHRPYTILKVVVQD